MKFLDDFIVIPIPWYRLDLWIRTWYWRARTWWFFRYGKIVIPVIKDQPQFVSIDDIVCGPPHMWKLSPFLFDYKYGCKEKIDEQDTKQPK